MQRRNMRNEPEPLKALRQQLRTVLKLVMQRRGLSHTTVARLCGYSQPTISLLLEENTPTAIDRLLEVLYRIDVDVRLTVYDSRAPDVIRT